MDLRHGLLALLLAISAPASADLFLDMGGASYHFENRREAIPAVHETRTNDIFTYTIDTPGVPAEHYNESNPGLGLRYETESAIRKVFLGGVYLNSYRRSTYYLGVGAKWRAIGDDFAFADIGVVAGVGTGYGPDVAPLILPSISFGIDRVAVTAMYSPKYDESPATVMIVSSLRLQ